MEEVHKDIIRQNLLKLAEHISPALEPVCTSLYSQDILSRSMKEDILERKNVTPVDKARALLTLVTTLGPDAFDSLYETVLQVDLSAAADILRPEEGPHRSHKRLKTS